MEILFNREGKALIVGLSGEVDHHTCIEIRERIDREYQKTRAKNLVFDFSKIHFMDSSGIGLLIGRYKAVSLTGGQVGISHVSPKVDKILNLSGVYTLLKVYSTNEEALEQLA